ncbi:MAG: DedA family protein [Actinobacteria bacterium]|jgi:membrane protein DedA with SNARE-associated domain|nr:DedA family protein [Actinomycetota bacterium]NBP91349.1 DedA family protein [Actinomycetota bacterium]
MISTFVSHILDLVAAAGPWVYVIVAVAAIAEGAAFVGLVFPAETTLIVAGAATATGHLKLSILIPIAILGAIIGDSTGYEIGRILGPRLRTSKPGRRVSEEHWNKAEEFLHKHGPWAVFLGRFVAVMRALVPAIAGTMRMKYGRFLLGNALGAAIWAPAALIIGRIASDNLAKVEKIISRMGYSFFALLILVVTFLIIRRRRKHAKERQQSTDQNE